MLKEMNNKYNIVIYYMYFHFRDATDDISWDGKMRTERCHFTTNSGQRCKRHIIIGLDCCFQHREKKYHVKVQPSTIPNAGSGLFATDQTNDNAVVFHKGDKIVPYKGELVNGETIEERYGDKTAPYGLHLNRDRFTDGALSRGLGTLINHKNRGDNVRFSVQRDNKEVNLVAEKNIKNKQELFVDYGSDYRFRENGVQYSTNRAKYKL